MKVSDNYILIDLICDINSRARSSIYFYTKKHVIALRLPKLRLFPVTLNIQLPEYTLKESRIASWLLA